MTRLQLYILATLAILAVIAASRVTSPWSSYPIEGSRFTEQPFYATTVR